MQIFSNAGQDEAEQIHRDAAKFIPADTVPSKSYYPFHLNIGRQGRKFSNNN